MNLATIAHEVKNAQDLCRQIQPLAARFSGFDIAAAYDVGRLIHEARVRAGASPVGRKIGFTNREIWQDYGIRDPIWGYVYDTTVVHLSESRGKCRLGGFVEPRIEPEIVLHFKSVPSGQRRPGLDPHVYRLDCPWIRDCAVTLSKLAVPGRRHRRRFGAARHTIGGRTAKRGGARVRCCGTARAL